MRSRLPACWCAWLARVLLVLLWLPLPVRANSESAACAPQILSMQAARDGLGVRPEFGWVDIELPDVWMRRWPDWGGAVWYRIDWQRPCADDNTPLALGIDGISMAGEVFINNDLLWRDANLVEPLSRSWNMPRWWLLPDSSLRSGTNTLWVRVIGQRELQSGLGPLRLGSEREVQAVHEHKTWRQRTAYLLTAGMGAAVGVLFLVVWLLRRQEQALGWYALVSLSWAAYLSTLLATEAWPFADTLGLSRLNIVLFVVYQLAFCRFTWCFSEQHWPRLERLLGAAVVLSVLLVPLVPRGWVPPVFMVVWLGFAILGMLVCLQLQWHVWWLRSKRRDWRLVLLALCWLVLLLVAVHDVVLILADWKAHETWGPLAAPVSTLLLAVLMGSRFAAGMQQIERFNHELEDRVTVARNQLGHALEREHSQALANAKLQERMEISHDLHDGLGASLVRGMALVEQSKTPLSKERVLSLFKSLRDDLRQMIDYGSSASATVPATPVQLVAPLRHRSTQMLDAMRVASVWNVAQHWYGGIRPTAIQCMAITRLMEEALSNVVKHSQARQLKVLVDVQWNAELRHSRLLLRIEDDGVGLDVDAVMQAGQSVGMRSMAARAERMGAKFGVQSAPGCTVVSLELELREPGAMQG